MNILELFKFSITNFARNHHKNIIYSLIVIISLSALSVSLLLYFEVAAIKVSSIDDALINRQLFITVQQHYSGKAVKEMLSEQLHVQNVSGIASSGMARVEDNVFFNSVLLITDSLEHLHIISTVQSTNKNNSAILFPDKIYVSSGNESYFLETQDLLGHELLYSKNHADEQFSYFISGIYAGNNDKRNIIYLENNKEISSDNSFIVTVDHAKNLDAVTAEINEIDGLNIAQYVADSDDSFLYDFLLKICSIFIFIITVLLFSMCITTVLSKISREKKFFALLKSIGYSNKEIFKLLFAELWIMLSSALLLSAAITSFALYPLLRQVSSFSIVSIQTVNSWVIYSGLLLTLTVIALISCLVTMIKVSMISPVILLKE